MKTRLIIIVIALGLAGCSSPIDQIRQDNECVECDLVGADLTQFPSLVGTNLTGSDLSGASLRGMTIEGANLTRVNLGGADIADARVFNTDLSHANLASADLRGTKLISVTMEATDLTNVDLSQSELSMSTVTNAQLEDLRLDAAIIRDTQFIGSPITGTSETTLTISYPPQTTAKIQVQANTLSIVDMGGLMLTIDGSVQTLKLSGKSLVGITGGDPEEIDDMSSKILLTAEANHIIFDDAVVGIVTNLKTSGMTFSSSDLRLLKLSSIETANLSVTGSTFADVEATFDMMKELSKNPSRENLWLMNAIGTEMREIRAGTATFEDNTGSMKATPAFEVGRLESDRSAIPAVSTVDHLRIANPPNDHVQLVIDGASSVSIERSDEVDLQVSGEIGVVAISNAGRLNLRGMEASIGELKIEGARALDYLTFENSSIDVLRVSNTEGGSWLRRLGIPRLTELHLSDLRGRMDMVGDVEISALHTDGVSFGSCSGSVDVADGEVINVETFGTCDELRRFGLTNEELTREQLMESVGSVPEFYANVFGRLNTIRHALESHTSVADSIGGYDFRGNVRPKQALRELLVHGDGIFDLPGRAIPMYAVLGGGAKPSGDRKAALDQAEGLISDGAADWLAKLREDETVGHTTSLHEQAIVESRIGFCDPPRLPSLPQPNRLKTVEQISGLVDLERSLESVDEDVDAFGECVRKARARYLAHLRPYRLGLVELTRTFNEQLHAIELSRDRARAAREESEREVKEAFYERAKRLYDIEELVDEEFITMAYLIEMSDKDDGFVLTGGLTSSEAKEWITSVKDRVSKYMNYCLTRPFMVDEKGFG